ncbi:Metalloenzyme, LuxS/M16 peptidase-like protein [Mycotypha africana]|uniref:Metalloenzyme, LuxS/M16 peptidase-like protein n=1 Tax=Mycotypha africana TaxID=64632 RepID=UPI0023004919|nr:Metalloenzyme, LuxS/M16 peptidase-like protein [Mycotypha africana]KAI8977423.1 Metalloenzyme, LuxS/M16 peptidase-like protein [Mycotypha africana]
MLAATTRKVLISTASKATYATAAAANAVKVATTSNGLKIASSEESGPTASLAVVINGGARAQNGSNAGVAHYLKNYGFKNNANRTAFRVTREAELAGGVLSSALSREALVYSAEFLKEDIDLFAELLSDVVSVQKFQEHEFLDVKHQTVSESVTASHNSEISAIEAAHHVAFRQGLGHSVFAKPTARISNATVKAFAQELFTQNNIALVGTNVDQATLEKLAETHFSKVPSSGSKLQFASSKYFGGEARIESGAQNGEFVIAFEGAAADSKEYAALQILHYALGGQSIVKYGPVTGLLGQAATKLAGGSQLKSFNYGYSDAGLFGVQVSAPVAESNHAISAAAEQLKSIAKGLSSEDFNRGVALAKFAAAARFDTRLDRLEAYGAQALQTGKLTTATEAISHLEGVSTSDVAKVNLIVN